MGEVYRARDSKLNREVAIKVLLPGVAGDPDRLARFGREAQLLASLNHSNIAQIYGIEDDLTEAGHHIAIVMELVEGEDLAPRIMRGPIPLEEALPIARQIADALEAAHDHGIVHRDLKPANIKIRADGTVKVLDFGLAKALERHRGVDQDPIESPTITAHPTEAGLILGTAAYMSPEQAKGRAVDKRADLWAFGVVLYEMLTGRRPFRGDGATATIASVLMATPDWGALPADVPAPIRRLLRRCLEKDPKHRLDSAGVARLEIDDALAPAETIAVRSIPFRRVGTLAMITAVAGTALVTASVMWVTTRPAPVAPASPSRFAIVPPVTPSLNVSSPDRDVSVSPDGRQIVYRAGGSSDIGAPLMLRTIDQLDARQLVGSAVFGPFFSPDSLWVAFFDNSEIKKVSIAGGSSIVIGPYTGRPLGGSWADDNTIVFATDDPKSGLWRVSADGGDPEALTTPVAAQGEADHVFPSVLSKGRGVLFTITSVGQGSTAQIAMLDLTTGRIHTLVRDGSHGEYLDPPAGAGQVGYLIYAAAGTLRAVRFDAARREVRSEPVTVVDRVSIKPTGAANFAVSRQGTLLYVPPGVVGTGQMPRSQVWVDRMGREEPLNMPLHAYGPPRVSPDGTRLAFNTFDQDNPDIWIWHLATETMTRLTFAAGTDGLPVWTPDSQRIIFDSARDGAVHNLYSQAADGTGSAHRFTTSTNPQFSTSVTADGKAAIGFERVAGVKTAIPAAPGHGFWVMRYPMANASGMDGSPQPLFHGAWPEVSPDGRYIAYTSDGPGRPEIYVRPFPNVDDGLWQITPAGGTRVAWARNGRELFYLDLTNTLTAVPIKISGSTFSAGKPAKVFDAKYAVPGPPRYYDVSPDGLRFLMIKDSPTGDPSATPASMVVILNWLEELKAHVLLR